MKTANFILCPASSLLPVALVSLAACGGGGSAEPEPAPISAAPSVFVTAPFTGSRYWTLNRTFVVEAILRAPAGLSRVELLVDGTVIGQLAASGSEARVPMEWDTTTVEDGVHDLTWRVTDANNAVATSGVTVSVANHPAIDVVLWPGEIWPVPESDAHGSGRLTFDLVSGAIDGQLSVANIAEAQAANIHQAYAGDNGPAIVALRQSPEVPGVWEPPAGSILTADQIDDLVAGRLYLKVSSDGFPEGEVRGQILPRNIELRRTYLTGQGVVPPVDTAATGMAALTMDWNAMTAAVRVNTNGAEEATDAHVNIAWGLGVAGDERFLVLRRDMGNPSHWTHEQLVRVDPWFGNDTLFTPVYLYVVLHRPGYPEGFLRGQFSQPRDGASR